MTKNQIKTYAAKFIEISGAKSWDQETHVAFVAWTLRQHITEKWPAGVVLPKTAAELAKAIQGIILAVEMPSLVANASAFRQWLESKDVALLAKSETVSANRYASLLS